MNISLKFMATERTFEFEMTKLDYQQADKIYDDIVEHNETYCMFSSLVGNRFLFTCSGTHYQAQMFVNYVDQLQQSVNWLRGWTD